MPIADKDLQELRRVVAATAIPERPLYNNKLDPRRRCAILALVVEFPSLPIKAVAEFYGVNRKTVGYIVRTKSPHYKSTRLKYEEMGHNAFVSEYMEEEAVRAALSVVQSLVHKEMPVRDTTVPDVYAKQRAGSHTINGVDFIVEFRNEIGTPDQPGWLKGGWFYVDEQFGPIGPFNTSTLAYQEAKEYYQ